MIAWGQSWGISWGYSWGRSPDITGGAKRKKSYIPEWDMAWQRDGLPSVSPEVVIVPEVVKANVNAKVQSQLIIEHRQEISRIRTQMRLSSNQAALNAMEMEINKIETHLKRVKQEDEDDFFILLLT